MPTEFPTPQNRFFKAKDFQDQEITLTYKKWEKKGNEDMTAKDGTVLSWKSRLKYMLRYSYPKFATDEAGEQIIDSETGEPRENRNYDPNYPKGWTVEYHFEEGVLTCGSLPLFNAFGMVQPKPNDRLIISRTGEAMETEWKVRKANGSATVNREPVDMGDEEIPF